MSEQVKYTPEQAARYAEFMAREKAEREARTKPDLKVVPLPVGRPIGYVFKTKRESASGDGTLVASPNSAVDRPKVKLSTKRSGVPRTLENAKLALIQLGIRCRYDEFLGQFHIEDGKTGASLLRGEALDDTVLVLRDMMLAALEFDPGFTHTLDAVRLLARQHSFDPVRDYLAGLRWDGVPRLDRWLTTYLGAKDEALTRAIGRKVLVAGVRRVRCPGCQFDFVPVLEGKQGTGKSTALRILAVRPEYFTDTAIIHQDHKEQQELLRGRWIVEMAELVGLRKVDAERFKNFASKTHDSARPAYGRGVENLPRRCLIIGTTNESSYLQDSTGNRRFWPVATGRIDLEGLRRDRDQLWAEAADAEAAGEALTIDPQLWGVAAVRQEERLIRDPWEDVLEDLAPCAGGEVVEVRGELRASSDYLLRQKLGLDVGRVHIADSKRLSDVMHRLGWEGPDVLRFGGKTKRGYRKPRPSLLAWLDRPLSAIREVI